VRKQIENQLLNYPKLGKVNDPFFSAEMFSAARLNRR